MLQRVAVRDDLSFRMVVGLPQRLMLYVVYLYVNISYINEDLSQSLFFYSKYLCKVKAVDNTTALLLNDYSYPFKLDKFLNFNEL